MKRRLRRDVRELLILMGAFVLTLCTVLIISVIPSKKPKETPVSPIVVEPEPVETKKVMSLVAVGDALIHGAVYNDAYIGDGMYDFNHMFTSIAPLIENYDLKYYNQETIIGGKNLGLSTYPRFNSPDEIALNLVGIGFNLVSLANNHTLDKNEAGVLNSVAFWKSQEGVVATGSSSSWEDRNSIPVYEENGIKYAFLSYTTGTNGLKAPSGKEYLVNTYDPESVKADIEQIQDKVDVIIVAMHWGSEYTHTPTSSEKEIAQYLSGLGVNLIIGTHPHVVQPIDYIGDTLVIYSLGNFISAQTGLQKLIGLMVNVDIVVDKDLVTFENLDYQLLYTYYNSSIKNFKVIPFSELSNDILNDYESIEAKYKAYVDAEVTYE